MKRSPEAEAIELARQWLRLRRSLPKALVRITFRFRTGQWMVTVSTSSDGRPLTVNRTGTRESEAMAAAADWYEQGRERHARRAATR